MPRPTIDHLLDCQIQIWRPTVSEDSTGAEERVYAPFVVVDAILNRPTQALANLGGGMAPTGGLRWYGRPDIDVQPRDVCEIISGPEVGKLFEVNSPVVRPKNHHSQVDCIEWHGILPDIGS